MEKIEFTLVEGEKQETKKIKKFVTITGIITYLTEEWEKTNREKLPRIEKEKIIIGNKWYKGTKLDSNYLLDRMYKNIIIEHYKYNKKILILIKLNYTKDLLMIKTSMDKKRETTIENIIRKIDEML